MSSCHAFTTASVVVTVLEQRQVLSMIDSAYSRG